MSNVITRPAALVKQGDLVLYTTSLKVSDLLAPNFYSVETLDPENANEGYQRLLNRGRAKKLADYIVAGMETLDAFLPTSIFLATDKDIPFDSARNTIGINISDVGSFSVVDGQHRLEGLRMAAEKDPRVLSFEVPVNIAIRLSKIAQMCHFLIVNTTQKSVDKGVEQRIFARITQALEIEDIPSLPKWIRNTVQKGEDKNALLFVDFLNSEEGSPWLDKIKMANEGDDNAGTVNQKSFVKAVKRYVLVTHNPMSSYAEDTQVRIFLNYWKAITAILGRDEPTVLFKYNGVELFSRFCVPFMHRMVNMPNMKVSTMTEILRQTFENVEGDYAGVGHTEFWVKGGKASFLNSGALNVINADLGKALSKTQAKSDVAL